MIEAYPFLRKLCTVLGLEFRVVDMRWGVREERRYISISCFQFCNIDDFIVITMVHQSYAFKKLQPAI